MHSKYAMMSGAVAIIVSALALAQPASAQDASRDVMKQCGEKWQAAKAANKTGNETWPQFLSKCRAELAQKPASAPAATAKPAPVNPAPAKPATSTVAAPKTAPAGMLFPSRVDPKYANEKVGAARRKTCLDQYNANKAANNGAGNGGMKWIQKGGGYYSQCNKRLSGA